MEKNEARLGAGNVEIELDGQIVTLKPSLRAIQILSRQYGGLVTAIDAVGKYDFNAIEQAISVGLNVNQKESRELPDKIFRTGLTNLAGPVISYLSILSNGGRPHETQDDDGDDTEGNPTSV
jgi:hypothetical protein